MQMDVWYDLLVQELTDGTDPAAELRKDAEAVHAASAATTPDDVTREDRGGGARRDDPSSSPARTCNRGDACPAATEETSCRA